MKFGPTLLTSFGFVILVWWAWSDSRLCIYLWYYCT